MNPLSIDLQRLDNISHPRLSPLNELGFQRDYHDFQRVRELSWLRE
jgi:hypothetical protein